MKSSIILIIGFLLHLSSSSSLKGGLSRGLRATDPCLETQRMYHQKGFNHTAPSQAIKGESLLICPKEYTCCTNEMEENLRMQSVQDFEKKVSEKSDKVKSVFGQKYEEFDDYFKELVESSRESLDILFYKTYGTLYTNNSEVFVELFDQLKKYYNDGSVEMGEIFDTFFTSVMQRVFKLMNSKYIFDDEYMLCIAENMNVIKPFDDFPERLSTQLRRAFIAARSFVRSLDHGRQLAANVADFYPTSECARALMRMSYCSTCQGHVSIKPCHSFCMNVMKGCLVEYNELNHMWNQYIDAMQMLLSRLAGPFNIEAVLQPMDVKISEAIMAVQDEHREITKEVFSKCGEPELRPTNSSFPDLGGFNYGNYEGFGSDAFSSFPASNGYYKNEDGNSPDFGSYLEINEDDSGSRRTRSLDDDEEERPRHSRKRSRRKHNKRHRGMLLDDAQRHLSNLEESKYKYVEDKETDRRNVDKKPEEPSLSTLVNLMKTSTETSRNHWNMLPYHVCTDEADVKTSEACWNGESEGQYVKPIVEDGHIPNPEVIITKQQIPHNIIKAQISSLRLIIDELQSAYKGYDPNMRDDDVEAAMYGYSGEGSAEEGSGLEPIQKDSNSEDVNIVKCLAPTCGSVYISYDAITLATSLLMALWCMMQ